MANTQQPAAKPNRFAGLIEIAGVNPQPQTHLPDSTPESRDVEALIKPSPESQGIPVTVRSTPSGKRSDPHYQQTSLYVRKDLYKRVRREIMDRDADDFSDLVEHLLLGWLNSQRS